MTSDVEIRAAQSPWDVAILLRNPLDCDSLGSLVDSQREFHVVGFSSTINSFVRLCERFTPDIAIVDASYPIHDGNVFDVVSGLVRRDTVRHVLFLDIAPNHTRARQAASAPNSGYVTRRRSFRELVGALLDLTKGHIPVEEFESSRILADWAVRSTRHSSSSALASLTDRELDVLQLIAEGHSVTECASILRLSTSTVENHKARLMKKLGIRRASQLVLVAVREGLVVP